MVMELEILSASNKILGKIRVSEFAKVKDVKQEIAKQFHLPVERQSIRPEAKGKDQKDDLLVQNIKLTSNKIYVKDLGPQIGWTTVFLAEYAGPVFIYLWVALKPTILYGDKANSPIQDSPMRHFIYYAWIIHYVKRLLETLFVHRFSHGTMPIRNLFKNCSYYWGFAFYVAYHVNHPYWTEPPSILAYTGLFLWAISELGNLSIHLLLRDLRPPGSTLRKIPYPNGNILTNLFNFVSCPNYTYEFGAWLGYTLMTGCLPAFIFSLAGLYQMAVWALGKHKNYKKEFPDYPKKRKAILPFFL